VPSPAPTEQAALALAEVVGAHALQVFVAALVLLLAAVALLAWSAERVAHRRHYRPRHPWARLALGVGLGFALIVGTSLLFAAISEEVADGGAAQRVDQAFMDAVQRSLSAPAREGFQIITLLGDPPTLATLGVIVTLLLWWRRERLLALGFVAAVAGNALLNTALKRVFERMRPLDAQGLPHVDGWSFPSGHSSGSLVVYGMLAYALLRTLPRAWHLPAVLAASAVAFSVGCSRVFVQAHFATDVLAGFASGSAWLVTCILSVELALGWQRRQQR